jgi:hypothetical protein
MVKHVMVLALSLVSAAAFAEPNFVKMTPERAATYRKGILELAAMKMRALQQAAKVNSEDSIPGCDWDVYSSLKNTIFNSSEVSIDQAPGAEPLIEFVQNPLSSREGETTLRVFVRTNPATKEITTLTYSRTDFIKGLSFFCRC